MANRQPESVLNSKSFKHGGLLLEVAVGLICQWSQAYGRSVMNKYYREKYERRSVYFISKETGLKSRKEKKSHWQMECHTIKEKSLSSPAHRT